MPLRGDKARNTRVRQERVPRAADPMTPRLACDSVVDAGLDDELGLRVGTVYGQRLLHVREQVVVVQFVIGCH